MKCRENNLMRLNNWKNNTLVYDMFSILSTYTSLLLLVTVILLFLPVSVLPFTLALFQPPLSLSRDQNRKESSAVLDISSTIASWNAMPACLSLYLLISALKSTACSIGLQSCSWSKEVQSYTFHNVTKFPLSHLLVDRTAWRVVSKAVVHPGQVNIYKVRIMARSGVKYFDTQCHLLQTL